MTIHITYYVHGTTTDNEQEKATGWNHGELSAKGVQQAKDLATHIAQKEFDLVISSDLQRATDSARHGFGLDVEILHDARLRECNYGDWNGADIHLFKSNMHDYVTKPFTNGESYADVVVRMRELCKELFKKHDGKHVAFMAHQAPQLALEVICNGKTLDQAIGEDWRNTKAWQPGWEYELV
jgi:broad specificity phosphatase PhoE